MSAINILFTNHVFKDINESFMNSLKAILYLSPPEKKEFKVENYIKMVVKDYREPLDTKYTVVDILLLKLKENCRRIYAYNLIHKKNRKQKFTNNMQHSNIEELIVQQNHIYSIFSLLSDKLYFGEQENREKRVFTNAVFGQDIICYSFDYLCYLGLHDSITHENRLIHSKIIENTSDKEKFMSDNFILKNLSHVIIDSEQKDIAKTVINCISNKALLNSINCNSSNSWNIIGLENLFKRGIIPGHDYTYNIINVVMSSKILDTNYYESLVEDKCDFEENLKETLKVPTYVSLDKHVTRNYSAKELCQAYSPKIIYEILKELTNPNLFLKVFTCEELGIEKENVFSFYNLEREETMLGIIQAIHARSVKIKDEKEVLKNFVNTYGENITKKVLGFIISLNVEYLDICDSLYRQIRIEDKIEEKGLDNHVVKKKKGKI